MPLLPHCGLRNGSLDLPELLYLEFVTEGWSGVEGQRSALATAGDPLRLGSETGGIGGRAILAQVTRAQVGMSGSWLQRINLNTKVRFCPWNVSLGDSGQPPHLTAPPGESSHARPPCARVRADSQSRHAFEQCAPGTVPSPWAAAVGSCVDLMSISVEP